MALPLRVAEPVTERYGRWGPSQDLSRLFAPKSALVFLVYAAE